MVKVKAMRPLMAHVPCTWQSRRDWVSLDNNEVNYGVLWKQSNKSNLIIATSFAFIALNDEQSSAIEPSIRMIMNSTQNQGSNPSHTKSFTVPCPVTSIKHCEVYVERVLYYYDIQYDTMWLLPNSQWRIPIVLLFNCISKQYINHI